MILKITISCVIYIDGMFDSNETTKNARSQKKIHFKTGKIGTIDKMEYFQLEMI